MMEVQARNSLNICRMGGMTSLLELVVLHENDQIRKSVGGAINQATANNKEVQNFASKSGAINLSA